MLINNVITYQEIIDLVKEYIIANCSNINDFNGMPAVFKTGYTSTGNIPRVNVSSKFTYTPKYVVTIIKPVTAATSTNVNADMNAFISKIGLTARLTDTVTTNSFLPFINDIISFCSTKLSFATSQYSTQKYLIYNTNNNNYLAVENIPADIVYRLAHAIDVTKLINILFMVTKSLLRNIPCLYNISLTY